MISLEELGYIGCGVVLLNQTTNQMQITAVKAQTADIINSRTIRCVCQHLWVKCCIYLVINTTLITFVRFLPLFFMQTTYTVECILFFNDAMLRPYKSTYVFGFHECHSAPIKILLHSLSCYQVSE